MSTVDIHSSAAGHSVVPALDFKGERRKRLAVLKGLSCLWMGCRSGQEEISWRVLTGEFGELISGSSPVGPLRRRAGASSDERVTWPDFPDGICWSGGFLFASVRGIAL
jgi:hypothetical protein